MAIRVYNNSLKNDLDLRSTGYVMYGNTEICVAHFPVNSRFQRYNIIHSYFSPILNYEFNHNYETFSNNGSIEFPSSLVIDKDFTNIEVGENKRLIEYLKLGNPNNYRKTPIYRMFPDLKNDLDKIISKKILSDKYIPIKFGIGDKICIYLPKTKVLPIDKIDMKNLSKKSIGNVGYPLYIGYITNITYDLTIKIELQDISTLFKYINIPRKEYSDKLLKYSGLFKDGLLDIYLFIRYSIGQYLDFLNKKNLNYENKYFYYDLNNYDDFGNLLPKPPNNNNNIETKSTLTNIEACVFNEISVLSPVTPLGGYNNKINIGVNKLGTVNFKDDYNLLEFMNQVKSINPIINYYINNNYKYLENFEYDTGDDLDPVNSIFMFVSISIISEVSNFINKFNICQNVLSIRNWNIKPDGWNVEYKLTESLRVGVQFTLTYNEPGTSGTTETKTFKVIYFIKDYRSGNVIQQNLINDLEYRILTNETEDLFANNIESLNIVNFNLQVSQDKIPLPTYSFTEERYIFNPNYSTTNNVNYIKPPNFTTSNDINNPSRYSQFYSKPNNNNYNNQNTSYLNNTTNNNTNQNLWVLARNIILENTYIGLRGSLELINIGGDICLGQNLVVIDNLYSDDDIKKTDNLDLFVKSGNQNQFPNKLSNSQKQYYRNLNGVYRIKSVNYLGGTEGNNISVTLKENLRSLNKTFTINENNVQRPFVFNNGNVLKTIKSGGFDFLPLYGISSS